jgi:hypothetical protein
VKQSEKESGGRVRDPGKRTQESGVRTQGAGKQNTNRKMQIGKRAEKSSFAVVGFSVFQLSTITTF